MAPKATWESPSPMKENLLRTRVTPKRDEQREIKIPTIKAYLTNEKLKYCINVFIIICDLSKKDFFANV